MRLITKELPSNHNLWLFGDLHDGSVLSSASGWNKLISLMGQEYDGCSNNYGADGGDMMEAIMVDDPRYSADKLTEPLPLEQVNRAIEKREPIKDKLLYILMGNHERALWKYGDVTKEVCEKLGIEYGTYTAKLTVVDTNGNLMYKLFDHHGRRGISSVADDPIRQESNMKLTLKRQLYRKAGDCAVMIKHHAHKLIVSQPTSSLYLVDDGKKIKQQYTAYGQTEPYIHPDARWYGCAGSFLKLYGENVSGYAEIAEYDPVPLGFLILKVRNKRIMDLEPYYLKL